MTLNHKHALIVAIAIGFLLAAPNVAAANSGGVALSQDFDEDFFTGLLENGAELVFAAIGPQGEPAVIYAQLGIPSDALGLTEPMYTDCMVMALVATQGELLDYIIDFIGSDLLNITGGGGEFSATQFGEGGLDVNSLLAMLGTDFSLLVNIFVNAEAAAAQTNMAAIKAHLNLAFGFVFSDLLNLRIDESFFPPEMIVTLPFESIDVFISQVSNTFGEAVSSVFSVMDDSGFLGSIDETIFSEARASGAGLVAIPDLGALADLIGGFTNSTPSASSFALSQMPELDGPLAVVFAGYIGDQVLTTSSTELNIFEDLLGKSSGNVSGLDDGQSFVVLSMPQTVNITSYSPEYEALNRTHYDNESGMVFWNATSSTETDYTVNFIEGDFPPLVTVTREFSPATVTPGESVDVVVAVHNDGPGAITNVTVVDIEIGETYDSVNVTGDTLATSGSIPAGGWLNFTYTVTFAYEGGYAFMPAEMIYTYNATTYMKSTHIDGYTVSADPLGLLTQMFNDGMPFTGIAVGVVGLGAFLNIALMVRGRGAHGGASYQV